MVESFLTSAKYPRSMTDALGAESAAENRLLVLLGEGRRKVSVIIPNYDYERYWRKRLRSVLDQTYRPCEVVSTIARPMEV
jgi:hypothetical protein